MQSSQGFVTPHADRAHSRWIPLLYGLQRFLGASLMSHSLRWNHGVSRSPRWAWPCDTFCPASTPDWQCSIPCCPRRVTMENVVRDNEGDERVMGWPDSPAALLYLPTHQQFIRFSVIKTNKTEHNRDLRTDLFSFNTAVGGLANLNPTYNKSLV